MINIAVIGFRADYDLLFRNMKTSNVNFVCGSSEIALKGWNLHGLIYLPGYEKMENLDKIIYTLKGQLIKL